MPLLVETPVGIAWLRGGPADHPNTAMVIGITRTSRAAAAQLPAASCNTESSDIVATIPMAALVAVMVLVAVATFDWHDPHTVVIDMTHAHIWDASSVAALDAITTKYAARGKTVQIIELNQPSARIHDTLAGQLNGAH